jgi:hypothetical protein
MALSSPTNRASRAFSRVPFLNKAFAVIACAAVAAVSACSTAPVNQVSHAVAVYPDAGAAHAALDRLESTLNQCASLHNSDYDFALNKPDTSTLKLSSAGWSHLYRVKSSVLVSVGVLGIEPTEQVANTVVQTITDRIK